MSGKYNAARQAFGEGSLSWTKDRIVAQLLGAAYRYSATHTTAAALNAKVGAAVELSDKSIREGYARAAQLVFARVTGDQQVVAMAIHRESPAGSAKPATLIAYIDGIEHFPMTPNGGDILVDLPQKLGVFRL